ncbi:hypothetical protein ColTof4_01165 [Colletotrichum tofieldiae]|nr:hypothetical protein ColTof3_08392 [Colletotrichum tofieldiae]GKT68742.1 hypothetical protein ColTof4_01165 [Colletotrichum tofieldiae]
MSRPLRMLMLPLYSQLGLQGASLESRILARVDSDATSIASMSWSISNTYGMRVIRITSGGGRSPWLFSVGDSEDEGELRITNVASVELWNLASRMVPSKILTLATSTSAWGGVEEDIGVSQRGTCARQPPVLSSVP